VNILKFLNLKTSETKRICVCQPSAATLVNWQNQAYLQRAKFRRRPTVAEAEDLMLKQGFVRSGLRAK